MAARGGGMNAIEPHAHAFSEHNRNLNNKFVYELEIITTATGHYKAWRGYCVTVYDPRTRKYGQY